jgi:Uma2 family endonuclease
VTIDTSNRRPPTPYTPPKVSWEDYLSWAIANEFPSEWVDGEIIEIMPPNLRHFLLVDFLCDLFKFHVRNHMLGRVFYDFLMLFAGRPSGRAPDIMFVANQHMDRLHHTYFEGPADLVVEVVSPDSEVRDRFDKLREYQDAGIPEYWLIDEPRHEALFFVLGEDGKYLTAPVREDGIYASTVLSGLRLRVDWLWRDPLPTLDEALADLPA